MALEWQVQRRRRLAQNSRASRSPSSGHACSHSARRRSRRSAVGAGDRSCGSGSGRGGWGSVMTRARYQAPSDRRLSQSMISTSPMCA